MQGKKEEKKGGKKRGQGKKGDRLLFS